MIPAYGRMSTRATNFVDKWLSDHVDQLTKSDVISVAEAIQQLLADAKAIGVSSAEIEEDIGSIYNVVLDAIVHHDAGMAD